MLPIWFGGRLAAGLRQFFHRAVRLRGGLRAAKQRRTFLSFDTLEGRWTPANGSLTLTVGPNVNITRAAGNQSETAIAINPTNTQNLFATSLFDFYKFSMDGGATWQNSNVSAIPDSCCDQQLAWDEFGNLFMTSFPVDFSVNPPSAQTILVLSTDGGASFTSLQSIGGASPAGPIDQPSVAVGGGTVWFDYNNNGVMDARGASVTGLGAIGSFNAAQAAPGPGGTFGDIGVGPGGQVAMVYSENTGNSTPANLYYAIDADGLGPQAFSSKLLFKTNIGSFDDIPAQPNRTIGPEANLAWDRTNGPRRGRVYLVYTDELVDESSDTEIFVRFSDDNGTTWSGPVRVNDDPAGNGKSQFNPAIALDQTTGDVAVTWYDARNSPNNVTTQVFGSVSRDGGLTWAANVQISAGTSNATVSAVGNFNYGDYDKMDFHGGVFYRTWADNSNSTGDNPGGTLGEQDMYTAQVLVSPPESAVPDVVLQTSVNVFNPVRYRRVRKTRFYHGNLTLLNKTSDPFVGPVYVIFTRLRRGVTIVNATGFTSNGKPYIRIDRNLNPNQAVFALVKVRDRFRSPLNTFFRNKGLRLTLEEPA